MVAWMRWINGMAWEKAWIQGPLEHGKEICSSFKSNEVIKIKSNRKSRNKFRKVLEKRKFQNPGCHKKGVGVWWLYIAQVAGSLQKHPRFSLAHAVFTFL